jgi:hypothetical protein
MTLDEFRAYLAKPGTPLTEAELVAFEKEIGTSLPDDYRAFLQAVNGGWVGGALLISGTTSDGDPIDSDLHHIGGLRAEPHMDLRNQRATYQDWLARIPRDLIWIMDDSTGNAICLGIAGDARGQVYFWDHEREPDLDETDGTLEGMGNISLLAHSFASFFSGLQLAARV